MSLHLTLRHLSTLSRAVAAATRGGGAGSHPKPARSEQPREAAAAARSARPGRCAGQELRGSARTRVMSAATAAASSGDLGGEG